MSVPPEDNALLTNLTQRLAVIEQDVRGNGQKGLKQKVARAESHLYYNPDTKDPGIVRKVNDHEALINGVRSQMRLMNWILGLLGTGGILIFLRALLGVSH